LAGDPDLSRAFELVAKLASSRSFLLKQLWYRAVMGKRQSAMVARWMLREHFPLFDGADLGGPYQTGLALFGLFSAETGLGQSARQAATALATTSYPVSRHLISLPQFRNVIDFQCETDPFSQYDTALIVLNAPEMMHLENLIPPSAIVGKRCIGFWAWELPVFPAAWARAFNFVDEIWVPSQFVATSISAATKKPVRVIPHAVPTCDIPQQAARQQLEIPEDKFIFLSIFDTNSFLARKNPMAVIRAFLDAFPRSANSPCLILKYHGETRRNGLNGVLREIASDERIIWIDKVFTSERMRLLQAACDTFISLHRAEGYGLNIAEAMAAGKLAIATNFSGNVDFMNTENSILIPYSMCRVGDDEYLCSAGQWWAEPDHDAAVEALRTAAQNSNRLRQLARQARNDMARNNSYARVGGMFVDAARGALQAANSISADNSISLERNRP
jgi:glycosyltransferase involved in cell wall biosynthesis